MSNFLQYISQSITWLEIINSINQTSPNSTIGIVQGAPLEFGGFISASLNIPPSQTGASLGALTSAFIVSYAFAILLFGNLVRYYRPFALIGIGLSIWCVAVGLSGLANVPSPPSKGNFALLMIGRILSGFGEASFQCVAPPFIDDYAPPKWRSLWLGLFYMAIPVGTAVGFEYGAAIASSGIGWQWAYWIEGILMLPFAVLCFFIPFRLKSKRSDGEENVDHTSKVVDLNSHFQSERDVNDPLEIDDMGIDDAASPVQARLLGEPTEDSGTTQTKKNICAVMKIVLCNKIFFLNSMGYAGYNATIAGLSAFGSLFMISFQYAKTESEAGLSFGVTVALAGK